MNKCSFEEFCNSYNEKRFSDEDIKNLKNENFYYQMLDVYGEDERAKHLWKKYQDIDNSDLRKLLEKQLQLISKLCFVVYFDPAIEVAYKESLRLAEWELYDFYLWDNEFNNTVDTVETWFRQWCYQFNFDLIEN